MTPRAECHHPKNTYADPVTGARAVKYFSSCAAQRVGWLSAYMGGYCGAPGRWFEPK